MSDTFVLNAKRRQDVGKGASRRLRREANELPSIIYGGGKAPENVTLTLRQITKALEDERFYSHVITLDVDGTTEEVILKDLQRHPAKSTIMHVDFQRVVKGQKMTVHVPLHFTNAAKSPGVKLQGGIESHQATELEIRCLPKDIPEFIEVDMGNMNVGDILHISDLKLAAGLESVALAHHHDLALASIIAPRVDKEPAAGEAPKAEGAGEEKKD
ncbi:MAG: 50S ribosomal protein L25/general stress protein Ctc [Gammaproteobacteria bacterium]|nr:MAG: 50S ribosomal protein L25/general stress protein Ctc [Gammaproteobacteria bacterium]